MTYAQNVSNVRKFLGDVIQPEEINRAGLDEMDPGCARKFAGDDLVAIILWMLKNRIVESIAEAWAAALQVMYLGEFRYNPVFDGSVGNYFISTHFIQYYGPLQLILSIFLHSFQ